MRDSPRPPRPPSVPALCVPGGVKHARYDLFETPGAGVWRAPRTGWYWALAYGPGGTGGSTPGTAASGGGGGGAEPYANAAYRRRLAEIVLDRRTKNGRGGIPGKWLASLQIGGQS